MLCLSACCNDNACRLNKQLNERPDQEAFSRFKALDAKDQVGVYLWELTHSKPVASRYEFLLRENAGAVAEPLLDAANRSDGYLVQASIVRSLARLPAGSRSKLARSQLVAAIERCGAWPVMNVTRSARLTGICCSNRVSQRRREYELRRPRVGSLFEAKGGAAEVGRTTAWIR